MSNSLADESPVLFGQNGRGVGRVVLRSGAVESEQYAADELHRHICAMLGVPPVRSRHGTPTIYLNDRDAAADAGINVDGLELGPEAFHLETRGGKLYILGGGPRGVLYGAYELLERLGCRWFAPELSHIPRVRRLELPPVLTTQAPAFEYRDPFNFDAADPVWRVRNRLNGHYTNVPGYQIPGYMGGQVTYGPFVHTFLLYVPLKKFFADHPEYYSLVGGVRQQEQTQICLTHPDVLRIVTERVLKDMRERPEATIFSVSQDDWENPCECPACSAVVEEEGSQSGPVLRFVNAVAERTSQVFPDNLIDTLAYMYTLEPPRRTVPHPNVRVRLAPMRCCHVHTFGTCDHPESTRFHRALEGWARITNQLYVWHYCTNFRYYCVPVPDFDALHDNLSLYHRSGVCGMFLQGIGQDAATGESNKLRLYFQSKLMWNPEQPVWPLVDEFLPAYYGAAAPKVRAYLDAFHARVREDRTLHPSLYDPPNRKLFDGDILPRTEALLADGEAAVRGEQRQRVRTLRNGLTHARLFRAAGTFRRDGDVYRGEGTEEDLKEFDSVARDWKRAGLARVDEPWLLDLAVTKFRNRLKAHKVEWLRDGEHAIAVVPGLGGRLIEWNAYGHQWLSPPRPEWDFYSYPMHEGYEEAVTYRPHFRLGWAESYRCRVRAAQGARGEGLSVSVSLPEGVRMSRTYALRDGVLHVTSRVANRGAAELKLAWNAQLHIAPPDVVNAFLSGPTTGGDDLAVAYRDIANRPPHWPAVLMLEGAKLPAGEWQVAAGGFRVTHVFKCDAIIRCIVDKAPDWGMVGLEVHTDQIVLKPGERIDVAQQIRIERT